MKLESLKSVNNDVLQKDEMNSLYGGAKNSAHTNDTSSTTVYNGVTYTAYSDTRYWDSTNEGGVTYEDNVKKTTQFAK